MDVNPVGRLTPLFVLLDVLTACQIFWGAVRSKEPQGSRIREEDFKMPKRTGVSSEVCKRKDGLTRARKTARKRIQIYATRPPHGLLIYQRPQTRFIKRYPLPSYDAPLLLDECASEREAPSTEEMRGHDMYPAILSHHARYGVVRVKEVVPTVSQPRRYDRQATTRRPKGVPALPDEGAKSPEILLDVNAYHVVVLLITRRDKTSFKEGAPTPRRSGRTPGGHRNGTQT
ncbi:hypothetical protein NMY22_g19062 [Coprinellus aureogranulatus]|nr:hypothetical protein NMY22_g19062 [Coprinellus aureogranulatus]